MRCVKAAIVIVAAVVLWPGLVLAQSESGGAQITGTVKDASDAPVPGVTIAARNADTGVVRTAVTHDRGVFVFPAMPIGPYVLETALQGFATMKYEGIVLAVGQNRRMDLVLRPAQVSEQVNVTAEAGTLDRAESASGTVIGARAIADLPMRGRNFTEFIQLSPTVVQESDRFKSRPSSTTRWPPTKTTTPTSGTSAAK